MHILIDCDDIPSTITKFTLEELYKFHSGLSLSGIPSGLSLPGISSVLFL